MSEESFEWPEELGWTIAIKHVTAPTNVRTVIVTLAPRAGFGNSAPIFMPSRHLEGTTLQEDIDDSYLLAANLNTIALDFVARQKIQGQNLNLFLLEQLPIVAPKDYGRPFGTVTAKELVRDHSATTHLHRPRHGTLRK